VRYIGTVANAVVLLAGTLGTAYAQSPSPCTAITDDKSRLQCFDAAAKAAATQPSKPAAPADDPLVAKAKAAVKRQLRDPGSAQFQDVKTRVVTGKSGVCGNVNSKNAMGGMTGPIPFAYDGDHAFILAWDAGASNGTSLDRDILAVTLGDRLKAYDTWCK
jgi:hypothetical protein